MLNVPIEAEIFKLGRFVVFLRLLEHQVSIISLKGSDVKLFTLDSTKVIVSFAFELYITHTIAICI